MLNIGIWAPLDFRARWQAEGISRVVKTAIAGAVQNEPSAPVKFHIFLPPWISAEAEQDVRGAILTQQEKVEFYNIRLPTIGQAAFKLRQRLKDRQKRARRAARQSLIDAADTANASNVAAELGIRASFERRSNYKSSSFERVINALEKVLQGTQRKAFESFAASGIPVDIDVWWVPFIGADGLSSLKGPKAANFFDFVSLLHPSGWRTAMAAAFIQHRRFYKNLHNVDKVIATSQHAVESQLIPNFDLQRSQTVVIPNPFPDYYRGLMRNMQDASAGDDVRKAAGKIIRYHLRNRDDTNDDFYTYYYINPFLKHLEWDTANYIYTPTQNRPYKNILTLIKAVEYLIRKKGVDISLVLTAHVDYSDKSDTVAQYIFENDLTRKIMILPRVPDNVHAALYAAARMAVHPSMFEGGIGSANFLEALYFDCPVLSADGPHTREASSTYSNELSDFVFPPSNLTRISSMIQRVLRDRSIIVERQQIIHAQQTAFSGQRIGQQYVDLFHRLSTES